MEDDFDDDDHLQSLDGISQQLDQYDFDDDDCFDVLSQGPCGPTEQVLADRTTGKVGRF